MKEIIVAIDFSKGSLYALDLSLDIANKTGADILMVWVENQSPDDNLSAGSQIEIKKEASVSLENLKKEYQSKLLKSKIDYKIRHGRVYSEIANQAKYDDADLIIAGTHGASGFDKWMGSNAFRIVTYSPCPVITIRYGFDFNKKLERIVLPIDSTMDTRQKVPFTAKIAKIFGAEIHIVGLYTTTVKAVRRKVDNYLTQVEKYLTQEGVKFTTVTLEADNITNETIKYAEQSNADLIAIMTEQEKTAANFLLGPYAQQMVNNCPIPVLSIQPKEINDAAR
jgi:nucleotide-binding universal stress UspA family protein